jgi:hypothetical protein
MRSEIALNFKPAMSKHIYFNSQALARLVAAEGKKVNKVICHLWQNRMDKNTPLEIIDNLELHFDTNQKLTISCNAEGSGLDAIDFDYAAASAEMATEFGDSIRLLAVDASQTTMWKDVIGLKLSGVRLSKSEDKYLADSLVLDFGEEKREISSGPVDGLVIDYFEE